MIPKLWGDYIWGSTFAILLSLPEDLSNKQQECILNMITSYKYILPCFICSINYNTHFNKVVSKYKQEYLDSGTLSSSGISLDDFVSKYLCKTRSILLKVMVDVYNEVNRQVIIETRKESVYNNLTIDDIITKYFTAPPVLLGKTLQQQHQKDDDVKTFEIDQGKIHQDQRKDRYIILKIISILTGISILIVLIISLIKQFRRRRYHRHMTGGASTLQKGQAAEIRYDIKNKGHENKFSQLSEIVHSGDPNRHPKDTGNFYDRNNKYDKSAQQVIDDCYRLLQ